MNKKEWTIYLAGLFDGEGSVGIYKSTANQHGYTFFLSVVLVQKKGPRSIAIMDKLVELFGGRYYSAPNRPNGNYMTQWYLMRKRSLPFLKAILPFLVIKRKQVEKCIRWQENKPELKKGPIPKNMVTQYSRWMKSTTKISAELKDLKKRGI